MLATASMLCRVDWIWGRVKARRAWEASSSALSSASTSRSPSPSLASFLPWKPPPAFFTLCFSGASISLSSHYSM